MNRREYRWADGAGEHVVAFVWVPATDGTPYSFGDRAHGVPIHLAGFYMLTTPVTQAFWTHVMGANPARRVERRAPVENVSWNAITEGGGFLDRLNASAVRRALAGNDETLRFRLPSETEWEYAARGGPHWRDDFVFSGSNDPGAVAWFGPRWLPWRAYAARLLGPSLGWRLLGRRR